MINGQIRSPGDGALRRDRPFDRKCARECLKNRERLGASWNSLVEITEQKDREIAVERCKPSSKLSEVLHVILPGPAVFPACADMSILPWNADAHNSDPSNARSRHP